MNDNHYRKLRLPRVEQALQAAVGLQTALDDSRTTLLNDPNHTQPQVDEIDAQLQELAKQRTALVQELAVLQAEDWRTADRTYRAVAADWFWTTPITTVSQQVATDPVLLILNQSPRLTAALQQQLAAWPRVAGKAPATLWDQVRSLLGGNDDSLDELILTGQRVWISQDANPRYYFDDVAVLLPVRLETIFKDGPDGQLLLIRVIPDEASIRRDHPQVSPLEAECLQDFWNTIKKTPPAQPAEVDQWLQTDQAEVAWSMLAARVEPRRAAWLVAAFPPTFDQGDPWVEIPPERIGDAVPNRIGGWPWEVEVWATLIDERDEEHEDTVRHVLLATLMPDADVTPEEREQRLQLPLPENLDAFRNSWLADWDQAKRLGLGGEILLPSDVTAAEIDVLSVIGLGDESPDVHFEALASAGQLGVLPLGGPTNSVNGTPTVSLATAAETWRDVAAQRLKVATASDADSRVPGWLALEYPLLGSGPALSGIPGSEVDASLTPDLVRALWPALWGYSLRDLWGLKDSAPLLGLWASENLHPEGPLPPIRIEDQPYALLPVTALSEWSPDDSGSELSYLEAKMAYGLANLCRDCARRVRRANPTIVDADTEHLADILGRSAVTPKFAYRNFVSTELVALALGVSQEKLEEAFEKEFKYAERLLENRPNRYHLALGWPQLLDLPLIAATRRPLDMPLAEMLHRVMKGEQPFAFLHSPNEEIPIYPDSLLIRLLLHSLLVGQAWYMQELNGDPEPLLNLPQWDVWDSVIQRKRAGFENAYDPDAPQTNLTELFRLQLSSAERLAKMLEADRDWLDKVRDPLGMVEAVWRMKIPADLLASYERQFRATLDTASHRIDPWITGIVWRRLKQQTASLNVSRRMGVYGWVDRPLRGEPGPTAAGRLHAPSQTQVLTAALLRDRYLSAERDRQWNASPGSEPDPNVWSMNLDSALIRMACGFAEEARLGCHLYEILGRRIEAILDTHQQVKILRHKFPLVASGPNPQTVCNGIEALKSLLGSGVPVVPVNTRQLEQLQELRRGLDAYADLLVADATHQIMTGHPDRAAEAMDASAGFSQPPRLDAIRTPPSGYHLATSLVSVLPWVPPPAADSATPPCRIAEPSLTAALSQLFPDVDSYLWQVRYRPVAESPLQTHAISLTALGWNMSDAAVLPEVLVTDALCAQIEIELSQGGQIVDVQPPREFTTARQIVLSLGQQPATARTLFNDGDPALADWEQLDTHVKTDLTGRLQVLRDACQQVVDTLEQNNADPAARLTALHRALAWGVVPVTDPIPQQKFYRALFGSAEPVDSEMLDRWAAAAVKELAGRLLRSNKAPVDKLPDLARAVAELATADGKLAILAGWPKALLRDRARLQIDSPEPALDDDWLSLVAAVRPQVARLEALQLQAMHLHTHPPWDGWTNSTGDPWQTAVVAANLAQRQAATPGSYQTPRFLAAYGPAGVWQEEQVAVGLIDEFSESIPMPQRSTFAAFGFNAPASRPPQAILLAVPPQPGQPLETRVLFQTVFETRELAHARAARLEELGSLQALAPSMMFPAAGYDGVFLTPTN